MIKENTISSGLHMYRHSPTCTHNHATLPHTKRLFSKDVTFQCILQRFLDHTLNSAAVCKMPSCIPKDSLWQKRLNCLTMAPLETACCPAVIHLHPASFEVAKQQAQPPCSERPAVFGELLALDFFFMLMKFGKTILAELLF